MEDKLKKIKLDKLVSEMNFLETELKYQKMLTEDAKPDFNLSVRKELEKRGKEDLLKPAKKEKKLNRAQRRAAKKASKRTSKLFKEIAKEIHPDKLANSGDSDAEKKKEKFLEANEAKDMDNSLKLYSIAVELGLSFNEIEKEDLENFESQLHGIRQNISSLKNSWVHNWTTQTDEKIKQEIIECFVDHMIKAKESKKDSE